MVFFSEKYAPIASPFNLQWNRLQLCRALYFLEPMLIEPGLGTSPGWCDHLASDEPEANADLAHLNPGSGCGLVVAADTLPPYAPT
jgi:hypothetical protein